MKQFKEKDRVVLNESAHVEINGKDQTGVVGTVLKVFEDLDVAIVEFEDIPVKVPVHILEKYDPNKERNEEDKPEEKIIITRDQFFKAVAQATNPVHLSEHTGGKMKPETLILLGIASSIVCKDVERILFGDND
jgi:hypothetical protein